MAETLLAGQLAEERSHAIRILLARPMLDAGTEADEFRVVARHHGWLVDWFEKACGWHLTVDATAGFARLAKRASTIDTSRPLTRTRGTRAPFDRRRYELLCLVAAELVRHPVITVGLLAAAVTADADLDTSRRRERSALVDALKVLIDWGALRTSAGDVEAFVEDAGGNAILTADTARLHRLLVSATAPSTLDPGLTTSEAADALLREPRYGDADDDFAVTEAEQRFRWVRHRLARRLLDDPVVHLDELSDPERDYLSSISGRRWLRERVAEAGLELEERTEGAIAIDADAIATDERFPAPHGNVHQCALLLLDRFAPPASGGADGRLLSRLSMADVRDEVGRLLDRFPGWAKAHRDDGGPEQLAAQAVALLHGFGLIRTEADGTCSARPALGRYRTVEPTVPAAQPSLFEVDR